MLIIRPDMLYMAGVREYLRMSMKGCGRWQLRIASGRLARARSDRLQTVRCRGVVEPRNQHGST